MPATLAPADVAVLMVEAAVAKHRTRLDVMFLKAVNAGIYLSIGGLFAIFIAGGSAGLTATNPGLTKLIQGAAFPVGLIMIVLQGQELLTSNMMTFPMGVLKRAIPWWSLPLNWFIVFWGNLLGSLFMAGILSKFTGTITADPYLSFIKAAAVKRAVDANWLQIFLRAIGCNVLVCIAVWQGMTATEVFSKVIVIWFPIMIFVTLGYDHIVANMFSLPLGIMLHADLTVSEYIKKSLFASLFGNIVGALIVALPFVYFYLRDWTPATALEAAETGMVQRDTPTGSLTGSNERTAVKEV